MVGGKARWKLSEVGIEVYTALSLLEIASLNEVSVYVSVFCETCHIDVFFCEYDSVQCDFKEVGVFLGEGLMFDSRLCCFHQAKEYGIVERGCLGLSSGSCCRGLKSLPA